MRRGRLRLFFLMAIMSWLDAATVWSLDKIRIGMGAFSPTNSAIWVAEERGFFKKHGIEAEAIFIGGGAARGVNALLAGDIQFATAGGGAVITATLRGSDLVMVAAQNNKGVHRVLWRAEIDTPEAIKGKKIAITTFGSSSHSVLTMVLDVWKIRPEELQILQVGSSPTMLISLQKKLGSAPLALGFSFERLSGTVLIPVGAGYGIRSQYRVAY